MSITSGAVNRLRRPIAEAVDEIVEVVAAASAIVRVEMLSDILKVGKGDLSNNAFIRAIRSDKQ